MAKPIYSLATQSGERCTPLSFFVTTSLYGPYKQMLSSRSISRKGRIAINHYQTRICPGSKKSQEKGLTKPRRLDTLVNALERRKNRKRTEPRKNNTFESRINELLVKKSGEESVIKTEDSQKIT
ncbi:hypothetical protein PL9214291308 [Planktothrix tepida PCC 9214]|uniref:Uncharacterized protein n=1 Tax=Planktothrix tepida PCC 9214 TaxID=671072 RepID=A0A1J1LGV6_9CYAN|nr:hypothetical protein PL9214291308 [Planktothrix tepida PCC 9214]